MLVHDYHLSINPTTRENQLNDQKVLLNIKGAAMQIEKTLVNDCLRASKLS